MRSKAVETGFSIFVIICLVVGFINFGFAKVIEIGFAILVLWFVIWIGYSVFKTFQNRGQYRSDSPGANAMTCRSCHNLAYPVSNTRNRYRCSNCGRQFAGRRHGY